MDAEQVVEKILADANGQADKIKAQANESQADEQTKADEQLDEYKKQTAIIAQKTATEKKEHILAAARMDIAKQYLAQKRKILDEVFEQAKTALQNLDDDSYRRLMAGLVIEAVATGDEEVIVDHNESRINQDFINDINGQLASKGRGNIKLSEEKRNLGAGCILKRGSIMTNASLEVLLAQVRKELEIELAAQLFAD
ncbi:MAG: V-type ATP synthase subunit E [Planctomycetota bacterium]|jgi:V/A-type H+-transporting ATPase subunit E